MTESTIKSNVQTMGEALEKASQTVELLQGALATAINDYIKAVSDGVQREEARGPYSSRRFSGDGIRKMSEIETEKRIASLEQQISKQDKKIANLEADTQNLRIVVKLLNETAGQWL